MKWRASIFLLPAFLLAVFALHGKVAAAPRLSQLEAKALQAEKDQHWQQAAKAYLGAAKMARFTGQLQKSLSYGTKSFELAQKKNLWRLQVAAILGLVHTLRAVGQRPKAREWLQKGLEIARQIKRAPLRQSSEAVLHKELGIDFLHTGETQQAIQHISDALKVLEPRLDSLPRFEDKSFQVAALRATVQKQILSALYYLAVAYQRGGKKEEAIKTYERGVAEAGRSGLKHSMEASFHLGLGHVYLARKDFARAGENLKQALAMAEKAHNAFVIQQAAGLLGTLYLRTRKPSEAIPYFRRGIGIVESMRSVLESEELRSSFFENKRQLYAGIIQAYFQTGNPEEAFNYNERARSRAFLDILGNKVHLARSADLMERERDLQGKIRVLQAELAGTEEEDAKKGKLRQQLEEARKDYEEFLTRVQKEDKEQASLMSVEPLTLEQVQALLGPEQTILEYFVMSRQALLWVVEKDSVRVLRIHLGRKKLVSAVRALRKSISRPREGESFERESRRLYSALLQPAMSLVRGKSLLIIPHDVLHYLPFQALLSPQGRYLIQDYSLDYLSSASLMEFTKEKKKAGGEAGDKALAMGNPNLGDPAYNLRYAAREAKEVAETFPGSAVYVGAQATKRRAVSLSPEFDILHFAVHGVLDEKHPLDSGLLLAGGKNGVGKLTAREIFSLRLKADTVVLSACDTGLGKVTRGDEVIGLTRAFLYAGASSVVTTLWRVDDRTSYELMKEFYTGLKSTNKSEALRQAQLKIMEERPSPFFWAAYALHGEP